MGTTKVALDLCRQITTSNRFNEHYRWSGTLIDEHKHASQQHQTPIQSGNLVGDPAESRTLKNWVSRPKWTNKVCFFYLLIKLRQRWMSLFIVAVALLLGSINLWSFTMAHSDALIFDILISYQNISLKKGVNSSTFLIHLNKQKMRLNHVGYKFTLGWRKILD